jgi:hypothetical protein
MADRKYYVLCESNCKFEGMTKEQIFAAIVEATGNAPTDIDSAFITKIKEQNKNNDTKFWTGTRAEYNAIVASGAKDPYTIYIVSTCGGFLVDIDAIDGYGKKEIDAFLADKLGQKEAEELIAEAIEESEIGTANAIAAKLSLSGGTMTGAIKMAKGNTNTGITNGNGKKTFGYDTDGKFYIGDSEFPLAFLGSAANPTYNGKGLALATELAALVTEVGGKAKIQTGTYQGTDSVSANNTTPTSLTFNFPPKLIFISGYKENSFYASCFMLPASGIGFSFGNAGTGSGLSRIITKVTISGNTVSWTYSSTDYQSVYEMNLDGVTYRYVAIG